MQFERVQQKIYGDVKQKNLYLDDGDGILRWLPAFHFHSITLICLVFSSKKKKLSVRFYRS